MHLSQSFLSNSASELKFLNEVRALLSNELFNPSEEFVRYFAKKAYPSVVTQKVLEQFTTITKKVFNPIVSDLINDRLKSALKTETTNAGPLTGEQQDEQEKSPIMESRPPRKK